MSHTNLPVFISVSSPPEAVAAVGGAFRRRGFQPEVAATWPDAERGIEDAAWALVVAVPLGYFMKALAEQLGKRAADALADLVGDLGSRDRPPGRLEIGDPEVSAVLILDISDISLEYDSLEEAIAQAAIGSEIVYDPAARTWRVE